ncbi:MAG TPA: hypothetical protein VF706_03665, partial [Solirubrobacteraceae bacterium]
MRRRSKATAVAVALSVAALLLCAVASAQPARAVGSAASRAGHKAVEPLPPIETSEGCEFIANPGSPVCMLPFPDDYYTVADPTSATGRRIAFNTTATPTNVLGAHI